MATPNYGVGKNTLSFEQVLFQMWSLIVANSWSTVLKKNQIEEKNSEVIVTHLGGYKFQIEIYAHDMYNCICFCCPSLKEALL